jgi:hypothetical protein
MAGSDESDQLEHQELHGTRRAAFSPPLKLKAEIQNKDSVCLAQVQSSGQPVAVTFDE